MACIEVEHSRELLYPAPWPRKTPTEAERYENNIEDDADCALAGVTILTSEWSIFPDDDDGFLILSAPFVAGFLTSILVAGGVVDMVYRIINKVTLSDGRVLEFMSSLPILATRSYVH